MFVYRSGFVLTLLVGWIRSTDIERMLGYSEAEHVVESIVELPGVAKERERRSSAILV